MKYQLITHNDLDGAGCELVRRHLEKNTTVCKDLDIEWLPTIYSNYDRIDTDCFNAHDCDKIILTDISPSDDVLLRIKDGKMIIIDHHKTAEEKLSKYESNNIHFDNSICGTKLFIRVIDRTFMKDYDRGKYDIAKDNMLNRIADVINDWDMWIHEKPDSKKYNLLYHYYGADQFIYIMLGTGGLILSGTEQYFAADVLQKIEDKYIGKACKKAEVFHMAPSGYKCARVFADKHISMIGKKLCGEKGYDIAMIIDTIRGTVSLRTARNDIDVSKIAETHSGGGHCMASGYQIKKLSLDDYKL